MTIMHNETVSARARIYFKGGDMKIIVTCSLPILFLLCRCMSLNVADPIDEDSSMIIGYVDVKEHHGRLSWVSFLQSPMQVKAYFGVPRDIDLRFYDDGLFIGENVKPGDYFLYQFSMGTAVFQVTEDPTKAKPFTIGKGEVYYWGALKVSITEATAAEQVFLNKGGTFSVSFSKTPRKNEVLAMAAERIGSPAWEDRIRKEMKTGE